MTALHPSDIGRVSRREPKPLHPVWGLVGGFGLICLAAATVHLLFKLL